jgi:MarR family protease production transcriptional regulator HPr
MSDIANVHLMMNYLRGAYKILEEEWQKAARSIGLTQAEQHTIWIVSLEKEATISRIAELGLWDVSTVMQVVKRLKEKELIDVKKKDSDRRVSYVVLTEKGNSKKEESAQFSYKIYDYLKEYLEESDENQAFMEEVVAFYRKMNQHFHGREFVNWIDQTNKELRNPS